MQIWHNNANNVFAGGCHENMHSMCISSMKSTQCWSCKYEKAYEVTQCALMHVWITHSISHELKVY
jgi:hypothetical protein